MTKIHMETDGAFRLADSLGLMVNEYLASQDTLRQELSILTRDWRGRAADDFMEEARLAMKAIECLLDEFDMLTVALKNEIEQWIQVDTSEAFTTQLVCIDPRLPPVNYSQLGEGQLLDEEGLEKIKDALGEDEEAHNWFEDLLHVLHAGGEIFLHTAAHLQNIPVGPVVIVIVDKNGRPLGSQLMPSSVQDRMGFGDPGVSY
ncbi:hypothetical protein ACFLYP_03380 [Chloroflexota bacterium]